MTTQSLAKESITVAQVGQYGVRVGDEWYGCNEPLTPSDFVPGNTYDVLYRRGKPSDKYPIGKAYINQIVGEGQAVTAATVTKTVPIGTSTNYPVPVAKAPSLNEGDKNVRILRQGVYQAVLQSPALAGFAATRDEYIALVKNTAEEVIKAIEGK